MKKHIMKGLALLLSCCLLCASAYAVPMTAREGVTAITYAEAGPLTASNASFGPYPATYSLNDIEPSVIALTNGGTDPLTVTSVASSGDLYAFVFTSPFSIQIAAGATDATSFSIRPTDGLQPGNYALTLSFTYDGGRTATATASIQVLAEYPALTIPDVDFGVVAPGETTPARPFALTNPCTFPVTVTGAAFADEAFADLFTLTQSGPVQIMPGATNDTHFAIQPKPSIAPGEYRGMILFSIQGNTPYAGDVRITVGGTQAVTVANVDFGQLTVGETPPSAAFVLTNPGAYPVTVTGAAFEYDSPETPFVLTQSAPVQIAPGASDNTHFAIQPKPNLSPGQYEANVRFSVEGGPMYTARVQVTIVAPPGSLTATNVDFGTLSPNAAPPSAAFVLTNPGSIAKTITAVTYAGATSAYSLAAPTPIEILPGAQNSTTFVVTPRFEDIITGPLYWVGQYTLFVTFTCSDGQVLTAMANFGLEDPGSPGTQPPDAEPESPPAPDPVIAPAAEAQFDTLQRAQVSGVKSSASVRSGPGKGYGVLGQSPAGDILTLLRWSEDGLWCEVLFNDNSQRGWVWHEYIK